MRERKFMLVTPVKMKTPVKKLGFVSDLAASVEAAFFLLFAE